MLIHLDHAFEMLLKAAIVHRGGRIREQGDPHTIGFDHCLRVAVTQGSVRFLSEEDAIVLRGLNSLRDASQHYLISLSEQQLYIQAQSAVTLFRSITLAIVQAAIEGKTTQPTVAELHALDHLH